MQIVNLKNKQTNEKKEEKWILIPKINIPLLVRFSIEDEVRSSANRFGDSGFLIFEFGMFWSWFEK